MKYSKSNSYSMNKKFIINSKIQSDGSVQQKCDALRKELDEKEK